MRGYSQEYQHVTKRLEDSDMQCIVRALASTRLSGFDRRTQRGLRDWAIIHFLIATGCRSIEVSRLRLGDVRHEHVDGVPRYRVQLRGKGGRQRVNVLTNGNYEFMRAYLQRRGGSKRSDSPLFCSLDTHGRVRTQEPVSRVAVFHVVRRFGERVGLPDLHPHRFRHSLASRFADRGEQAFRMMAWFGWSQMQSAQRYVAVSDEAMVQMSAHGY